jgi:hypothetical protein
MFLVATGDLGMLDHVLTLPVMPYLFLFLNDMYIVVNLYRFLRAFVLHVDPLGPTSYFFDFTRWDALAHNAMLCIMTWLGDALVVSRHKCVLTP